MKDPEQVRKLGKSKEGENLDFRADLKGGLCSEADLDALFHRLETEVSAQIDCTQCARCCVEFKTTVSKAEARWMARKLGKTVEEFQAAHMDPDDEDAERVVKAPCPMLEGKRCSIHDERPKECRSYPHLHKREMWTRLLAVVGNAELCPSSSTCSNA